MLHILQSVQGVKGGEGNGEYDVAVVQAGRGEAVDQGLTESESEGQSRAMYFRW